jgi:hypothetical protein
MPTTGLLGARNPRALAEAILGKPIDWNEVPNERELLEEVLATPYEQLFDPKYDSPVYLGVRRNTDGALSLARPSFLDVQRQAADAVNDQDRVPDINLKSVQRLADLKSLVGASIDDLPIRSLVPARAGGWTIEFGRAPELRLQQLSTVFSESVLAKLWTELFVDTGWTPPGGEWKDVGSFFHETAEFFDPIQWGLADCWLVSAMSSVAWSMPYTISQRTRATGPADQNFVNLIELVDPSNGARLRYELTDETVVYSGTTSPMYSHSSEPGELWPAIIEKSFANWRRGTNVDHPDLTALNYGDCVHASAAITGRKPYYTATASSSTTDLLTLVKSHSLSHRTFDPMTAWTYGSADDAPDDISYATANIVANHCYSVLGWVHGSQLFSPKLSDHITSTIHHSLSSVLSAGSAATSPARTLDAVRAIDPSRVAELFSRNYIVLRNPWGNFEATTSELGGVISLRDISFWRSIDLDVDDGVFAIDVAAFKRYFAGIGVAL